jgi:hypothetical protein
VSRHDSAPEAERDEELTNAANWRAVTLIQVDVDDLPSSIASGAVPGDRVWIEATKHGQVVGVVEARAGNEGVPASVLKELLGSFSDAMVSSYDTVPDELLPKASVVVPTICQNPAQLLRTVNALLQLNYPDFEILIVDNRAGRPGPPFPEFPDDERVQLLSEPMRGISAARNRGVAASSGEFVAFTDDDAVVDPDWLRALGARFVTEPEVGVIGGLVLPLELDTEPQLWFEEFYGGFSQSFQAETLSIEAQKGKDPMFPYASTTRRNSAPPSSSCNSSVP